MQPETPLRHYANLAWRRKWFLIVPAVLGLAAAAVLLQYLPNVYEAVAKVTREREGDPLAGGGGRRPNTDQERMALARLQLPDFTQPVARKVYGLPDGATVGEERLFKVKNALVLELYGDLIYFKARGADPEFVTRVANFYAEDFLEATSQKQKDKTGQYASFYDKQLKDKMAELEAKDREIAEFRGAHRGTLPDDIPEHSQAIERLRDALTQTRADLEAREGEREAFLQSVQKMPGEGDGSAASVQVDPQAQLQALQKELATLKLRLTDKHPDVQAKIREIEALRAQIAAAQPTPHQEPSPATPTDALDPVRIGRFNYNQLLGMDREILRLKTRATSLQADLDKHMGAISVANGISVAWTAMNRERANVQQEYEGLNTAAQKAALTLDLTTNVAEDAFRLQQPAGIPLAPVSPVPLKVLAIGLGAGLMLGAGLVALREFLDQTYTTPEELSADLEIPVLATIMRIEGPKGGGRKSRQGARAAQA